MPTKKIIWTVFLLLAFAALMLGIFVAQYVYKDKSIDMSQFHGTLLSTPREIAPFNLIGIDNKPFNAQNLQQQWTLFFFGFTHCASLCPTTMGELAKMYRLLAEQGVEPLPRVVMISLDPARDTPEILQRYVTAFNPNFYGARGEEKDVEKMTREMGIVYNKAVLPANDYDIQHSGALMLFNPQGQLNAFFTTPHQADLLAKDYQLLLRARSLVSASRKN